MIFYQIRPMYQRKKRAIRRDALPPAKKQAKIPAKIPAKVPAKIHSQAKKSAQAKIRTKPKRNTILPELVVDVFELIISCCSPVGQIKMRSTCKLLHDKIPEALDKMKKIMEGDDVHKYFEGTFVHGLVTNLPGRSNNLEVFCGNRYIDMCPGLKYKHNKYLTKEFNGIPISLLEVQKMGDLEYYSLPMRWEKSISVGHTLDRNNNHYFAVIDFVKNSDRQYADPVIMDNEWFHHSAHIYSYFLGDNITHKWAQSSVLPEKSDNQKIYCTTVLTGALCFKFS